MKHFIPIILVFILVIYMPMPFAWAMAKRPPAPENSPSITISASDAEGPLMKLSDLIEEALKKNPELEVFKERWKAAKARVWKEMSWDDTKMGADFEGIPGASKDPGRNSDIEWMIEQKIPFPGKRFLKGRVASQEAKMTQEDYKAKEREIISEVKKAYSEYFLRDHEVMLHEDTKRILERLSKSAEARYATGQISYSEVLRAHTELAVIINDVAKHRQQRETALALLNSLLGREADQPLRISVAVPERKEIYSKKELMQLALEKRPELQAVRYGVQAAKLDSASAWLDLLPDGEFRIEAKHFKGEGSGIKEYDQFYGFEVPVLSMLGRIGQIREKRAEKHAAEAASSSMKNLVLYEVTKALSEFESNDRSVKVYRADIVPQAEAALNSALAEYESGKGNFLAVMEAQKALTEFRHEYFHSLSMREESFAELERMVGVELEGGMVA